MYRDDWMRGELGFAVLRYLEFFLWCFGNFNHKMCYCAITCGHFHWWQMVPRKLHVSEIFYPILKSWNYIGNES